MQELVNHFREVDLDIRGTRAVRERTGITPRFMDQKCTPDVLASSANWILSFSEEIQDKGFTTTDVWDSPAFANDVRIEFSKPEVNEESAQHEFDKVIAQPLKTLAFAGLLSAKLVGRSIEFRVVHRKFLEFISHGPRNARIFLCTYLECVLEQSGIYHRFQAFFESEHSQDDYLALRDSFIKYILSQTYIRNETEIRRIFPKVLNPLAHQLGLPGSISGRVSKEPIMYSSLLYNQVNFRDKGRKQKRLTRRQASILHKNIESATNESMQKMMNAVRKRHEPQSEVNDNWANGYATQVHHIFPKSRFASLASVRENLILLTPTQHNTLAHSRNITSSVNFDYQIECLLAKTLTIEQTLYSDPDDDFYSLERMIDVINTGYNDIGIPKSSGFDEVRLMLREYSNARGTKAMGSPTSTSGVRMYRLPESGGRESGRKDLE